MHSDIAKVKHNLQCVGGTSEGQQGGLWLFHAGQRLQALGPSPQRGPGRAEPLRGRGLLAVPPLSCMGTDSILDSVLLRVQGPRLLRQVLNQDSLQTS